MQREIKLRAWDKKQKSFINGFNMIGFSTGQGAPKRKLQRFDTYWDEEEVVIMQYTGLKDKNGKEIYEGDIVKFGEDEIPYEVYRHDSGSFDAKGLSLWEWISENGEENEWEVIGNTHDNPELLQKAGE